MGVAPGALTIGKPSVDGTEVVPSTAALPTAVAEDIEAASSTETPLVNFYSIVSDLAALTTGNPSLPAAVSIQAPVYSVLELSLPEIPVLTTLRVVSSAQYSRNERNARISAFDHW